MIETILTNPLTLWLRWLVKFFLVKIRYPGGGNHLGYLADIQRTKLSRYNIIHKYSRLRDVEIGRFSYVNRDSQVYSAEIGNFVCIGPGVIIGPGEHPTSGYISSHPMFYSLNNHGFPVLADKQEFEEFPVTKIGNDVWIGARAILKSGIRVGDGAIIAAGAVVTKDVEPYSVVGGVPAKHIRYRFEPNEIKLIRNSQWWNNDIEWLKEHKNEMTDVSLFLKHLHG